MGLSTIDPQLPLIDLHRHIDGSVRLTTILELGKKHGVKLPALDLAGDEANFPPKLFVEHSSAHAMQDGA